MVAFGHISVGAVIGSSVVVGSSPATPYIFKLAIVIVIAWLSHYATDFIPHGHYHFETKQLKKGLPLLFLLDTAGSFALLALLLLATLGFSASAVLVVTGMVAAVIPDILESVIDIKHIRMGQLLKSHRHFHQKVLHWHNQKGHSLPWGMRDIWQVVTAIVALLVVGTLPR